MCVVEAICVFQAITKYTIHAGMSKQDDPSKQQPLIREYNSKTQYDYCYRFMMEKIITVGTNLRPCNITQHTDVRSKNEGRVPPPVELHMRK